MSDAWGSLIHPEKSIGTVPLVGDSVVDSFGKLEPFPVTETSDSAGTESKEVVNGSFDSGVTDPKTSVEKNVAEETVDSEDFMPVELSEVACTITGSKDAGRVSVTVNFEDWSVILNWVERDILESMLSEITVLSMTESEDFDTEDTCVEVDKETERESIVVITSCWVAGRLSDAEAKVDTLAEAGEDIVVVESLDTVEAGPEVMKESSEILGDLTEVVIIRTRWWC